MATVRQPGRISVCSGKPDAELISNILLTRPEQLRVEDMEELLDALHALGYSNLEIMGRDFGQLLALSLGLEKEKVRAYAICRSYRFHGADLKYPLFTATLTQQGDGVAILCGYGLNEGYEYLSEKQILRLTGQLMVKIVTDMVQVLKVSHAVCNVKASNKRTLRLWRFMKKYYERKSHLIRINIVANPFDSNYKLVTLSIGE